MSRPTLQRLLVWHEAAWELYSMQTCRDTEAQEQRLTIRDSPHTRQDQCQEKFDSQLLCFGPRLHSLQLCSNEPFYCVYANVLRANFQN